LQRVRLCKGPAKFSHHSVLIEPLDGPDVSAVARDRVGDAGARDLPVDLHGTGTADAVFAADVGAGEQQLLAQELGELRARRHLGCHWFAIDGEGDARHGAKASSDARLRATA
jgi:hypothetical protein